MAARSILRKEEWVLREDERASRKENANGVVELSGPRPSGWGLFVSLYGPGKGKGRPQLQAWSRGALRYDRLVINGNARGVFDRISSLSRD